MSVELFLADTRGPIFDVRSPCEFSHAHIPESISLPLFTDAQRAYVGTTYKQLGHDAAVLAGLKEVGPKLFSLAEVIRTEIKKTAATCCRVTCFRGGMRSRSVAWLCEFLGFPTLRLEGGYKAYRQFVLDTFSRQYLFKVIGGPTGSGKTQLIHELAAAGHQTIDLEGLANHRGSAFGLLPNSVQPSTEQFENLLAERLLPLDRNKPIYIEDESRLIGSCAIPKDMYDQMDRATVFWLEEPFERRVERSVASYGQFSKEWLKKCAEKLTKRLGGQRLTAVISALDSGQLYEAASILMKYYDDAYLYSRSRHNRTVVQVNRDFLDACQR